MSELDEAAHIFDVAAEFTTKKIKQISPVTDGAINQTFEVSLEDEERFIVQGMSPIFEPFVLDNLKAVQAPLLQASVLVPACIPTNSGDLYLNNAKRWYRALTYIDGVTIHDGLTPDSAYSAAKLIAQFHDALAGEELEIKQPIKHFHDTYYYAERLKKVINDFSGTEKEQKLMPLVKELLHCYEEIKHDSDYLPKRIIHGDLKISNVRFDDEMKALALIDMDTMMLGTIETDMGDALRSWCGTAGEDSSNQVFDKEVFEAALDGYKTTAKKITEEEVASIPRGVKLLALELAIRFVTDAFEESYFAKSSHYDSLFMQNKTRAENQLLLLREIERSGVVD